MTFNNIIDDRDIMFDKLNLASLKFKLVVDPNGNKLGRIKDAVVNRHSLSVRGFVIKGSVWEELLENLGIKKDVDPLLPIEIIEKISDSNIVINKLSKELQNTMDPSTLTDDEVLFSSFKEMPIFDKNGDEVGFIIDIHFDNDKIYYQLGGKKFIEFLKSKNWSENLMYLAKKPDFIYSNVINGYELQSTIKEMEMNAKQNLSNLVRDLMTEAGKDGKITMEEQKLIDTVTVEIEVYYEALDRALEDGIITANEQEKLEEIKEQIIRRSYIVAQEDNQISKNEQNLIKKLAAYMVDERKEIFWKIFGTSPGS
jgi:sporulation protein YlmC with PRC-barrel domain